MIARKRLAILLPVACSLAACATTKTNTQPATTAAAAALAAPPAANTPAERFQRALQLLQDGQPQQADEELHAYLKDVPDSKPARDLVAQIETPLDKLFPIDNFHVVLAKDESLSSLAKTYLGDPLSFYALARYNAIAVPAKVNAGQPIKIPKTPFALAAEKALAAKEPDEPETPTPTPKPKLTAGEIWKEIEADVRHHRYGEAVELFDANEFTANRAQARVIASAYAAEAKAKRERNPQICARYAMKAGQLYFDADEPAKAMEALDIALAAAPGDAEAAALRQQAAHKIADRKYKEGMIAFQHQDLDGAIAAWDKVVALEPEYKDVQLNRSQALKLKENLKKLQH
jgi:tetratricopeptide (TPR) repeat protein